MVRAGIISGAALLLGACVPTRVVDYAAVPVPVDSTAACTPAHPDSPIETDGAAPDAPALEAVRPGFRIAVGAPSVFPYSYELGGRKRQLGHYQLFTRVLVENTGAEPLEVLWLRARLEDADGTRHRLMDSGFLAALRAGMPTAPSAPVDTVAPGGTALRALIPQTLERIAIDQPLVKLCSRCEYRLLIPVRVGWREEEVALVFRLEAGERAAGRFRRWFFRK